MRPCEPDAADAAVYQELYPLYRKLYFAFGERQSAPVEIGDVLPELRRIAARRKRRERVLEALRAEVLEANLELVRRGLVIYTFGNASGVSREQGLVVIKPSGVPYDKMTPERHGDHRSGRPRGGRRSAAIVRPGDARGAVSRVSRRSAAWCTRIRAMPPPGRRRAARSPASAPRTPIISTAPCR